MRADSSDGSVARRSSSHGNPRVRGGQGGLRKERKPTLWNTWQALPLNCRFRPSQFVCLHQPHPYEVRRVILGEAIARLIDTGSVGSHGAAADGTFPAPAHVAFRPKGATFHVLLQAREKKISPPRRQGSPCWRGGLVEITGKTYCLPPVPLPPGPKKPGWLPVPFSASFSSFFFVLTSSMRPHHAFTCSSRSLLSRSSTLL